MVYDGVLTHQPNSEEEKAYDADITYGTNNEFGFDYLEIIWLTHQLICSKKTQLQS
jgi:preprotein translocase subunit SecA